MLVGYARVSTDDQDLTLQRTALKGAGCKRVYEEKVSGAKRSRPELSRMLDQLRADDVVVVSRLDRLARSTRDLLDIAEQLKRPKPVCGRCMNHGPIQRRRLAAWSSRFLRGSRNLSANSFMSEPARGASRQRHAGSGSAVRPSSLLIRSLLPDA